MRGRPKGSKNKRKCSEINNVHVACTNPELEQEIGRFVRYFDKGWRFAKLIEIKKNRAHLLHPVSGPHWIDIKEVEPNPWQK